jgi:hypothetical protein
VSHRVRHRLNRPLFGLASHCPALLRGRSALPQVPWPPWAPVHAARPFWPISGHARWSFESAMPPWCSSTPPLPPLRTTVAGRASAGEAAAAVAGSRGRPYTGSPRPSLGPPTGAAGLVDSPGPLFRRWRSPRRPESRAPANCSVSGRGMKLMDFALKFEKRGGPNCEVSDSCE